MIDTHAHIYLDEFKEDIEEVINRANAVGIQKILMPNIDVESIPQMLEVEKHFPEMCTAMIGLHPCYVKEDFQAQLKVVEEWLKKRSFLAIGEIGTDLYWDKSFWTQQQEAFHHQCQLALEYQLPVVIHCRESIDETIAMVSEYVSQGLTGVFHCFTGSVDQGKRIADMNFYLGLGGVSTFKNGGMDQVIPYLDKSKIILETDAPYLAPTPHRGRRNEPSYLTLVAKKVAELIDMSEAALIELTRANTNNLFYPK